MSYAATEVDVPGGLAHAEPVTTVDVDGVSITILGTAHISKSSADAVEHMIDDGDYDAVALELCQNRFDGIKDPNALARMDLLEIIRKGKGTMVMASLALGAFQQRLADQLGVEPGADMRAGIKSAEAKDLPVLLIDRDLGVTLKRVYRSVPWWRRLSVFSMLMASVISKRSISEQEVEQLKQHDALDAAFNQFAEQSAEIYQPLIDERDHYMAARLIQEAKSSGCKRILAVVGAGHMAGMLRYFASMQAQHESPAEEVAKLEQVPPASMVWHMIPWLIVAVILTGFAVGFSHSSELGWGLVQTWVLINGTLAALGAMLVGAHPITIVSAFIAAPLTSLNPTISAGVVTAAVEAMVRKPSVGDFVTLRVDTSHFKGWWTNRVAHTFMVFFMTGMGSVLGTYVAGYKIFESIAVA